MADLSGQANDAASTSLSETDTTGDPRPPIPSHGAATGPGDHRDPGHRHLGLALVVISVAQLMVVLDASIVNIALPTIQRDLHFSPTNLVWVINAYTLAFGGLLLLGGRTGDLFGKRRMFMIGIGLFAGASFMGGLATTEGWLITCRALQGVGGAIAAPTALSLIASTFPEGPPRNRAMGVYAAMSGGGAAIGVLLGGVLTSSLGWRWVFFVNVPIGVLVLIAAPFVLAETDTRKGRLDLPGALTATGGMTALVFGLIHAASTSWSDVWTVGALIVGAVLLATFVLIEARSPHALMPLHLFRTRNRSGAYIVMLCIGAAMFAMFYFLTLFLQDILGYSAMRAGASYLPFALMIVASATVTAKVVGRTGPKIPLLIGTVLGSAGLFWFSRVSLSTTYIPGILGPMLLISCGIAMCFVPLTLTAVAGVNRTEQGIASALLNSGQQVGGSLGLAVLGTIAATVTRGQVGPVVARLGEAAARLFGAEPPPPGSGVPPVLQHAIAGAYLEGYTTAFEVGAGIMLFAFLVVAVVIRVPRASLAGGGAGGAQPAAEALPAG